MSDCPHCQAEITTLSGFITQGAHEARMKTLGEGKAAEVAALTAKVRETSAKASGYDAVVAERDSLKQANEARGLRDERTTQLREAGVDVALLEQVEQVYGWSQSGLTEADQKPYSQWVTEDAAAHVLLSSHFSGTPPPVVDGAPPPPGPPAGDGVPRIPPSTGSPPPPPSSGKITEQDLANYMASPAYQNLPTSTEKRAKMTEWGERIAAQG